MRNAILAAFIVFVAAVLVTGAQGYPTPQCTCPDGYVAQCVAMTAVPPTVTPAPTSGGGEMASEGPNSPSASGEIASPYNPAGFWNNEGNVYSSNNSYATTALTGVMDWTGTPYLTASTFGFAIPDGATIDGIKVEVEAKVDRVNYGKLYAARLLIGGSLAGTMDGTALDLTGSDAYYTYGGETSKWGLTPSAAEINNAGFGVGVVALVNYYGEYYTTAIVSVDHIRITVYYTEGAGGATRSQYRAMLGAGW